MRTDFVVQLSNGEAWVVEIKTVIDTDYNPSFKPAVAATTRKAAKEVKFYAEPAAVYERSAIFPWGGSNQKGPNGEKVVSARALKHLRELTAIANGDRTDAAYPKH